MSYILQINKIYHLYIITNGIRNPSDLLSDQSLDTLSLFLKLMFKRCCQDLNTFKHFSSQFVIKAPEACFKTQQIHGKIKVKILFDSDNIQVSQHILSQ